MSVLRWLFPSKKAMKSQPLPESSGLSRMEATRPVSGAKSGASTGKAQAGGGNGQPANRKGERMARRELLYGVVREAMAHAGMLSMSYKFKVLSLDSRGRQFLVMVDLAREYGDQTSRLAEIEALIAQSAKTRHDIVVTAVYWRLNEHVAVGLPLTRPVARPSSPMPLEDRTTPLPIAPASARFEPLQADEVAAFKQALAAGVAVKAAPPIPASTGATAKAFTDGTSRHGPQSYTLLTGYEDTEMPEENPALSGTQYGALT